MKHKSRINYLRLLFTFSVTPVFVMASCHEIDPRIRLEEGSYPPVFNITGGGLSASFVVFGPFENVGEWQKASSSIEKLTPVWEVNSPPHTDKSVSDYSPLTYGKIPSGFSQKHPKDGNALQLSEGKIYYLLIPVNSANWTGLCFFIKGGKAHTCERYR
jgi:hypothetical protein